MLNEPASKLVTYLDHPNGWWRDNAQQLLIVRNDLSVVPALKEIATGGQANLAKKPGDILHAFMRCGHSKDWMQWISRH